MQTTGGINEHKSDVDAELKKLDASILKVEHDIDVVSREIQEVKEEIRKEKENLLQAISSSNQSLIDAVQVREERLWAREELLRADKAALRAKELTLLGKRDGGSQGAFSSVISCPCAAAAGAATRAPSHYPEPLGAGCPSPPPVVCPRSLPECVCLLPSPLPLTHQLH